MKNQYWAKDLEHVDIAFNLNICKYGRLDKVRPDIGRTLAAH